MCRKKSIFFEYDELLELILLKRLKTNKMRREKKIYKKKKKKEKKKKSVVISCCDLFKTCQQR